MLASAKAADFTTEMIGSKVRLWGCHDVDLRSNRVKRQIWMAMSLPFQETRTTNAMQES